MNFNNLKMYLIPFHLLMTSVAIQGQFFTDQDYQLSAENCKKVHLGGGFRGIIRSPNYPYSYRNQTSCTWYIAADPDQIVTLSFSDLNIEVDPDQQSCLNPPCCTFNWVKIGHGHDQKVFCGQNDYPPASVSIPGDVWIKFHTATKVKGGRGFQLDYVIVNLSGVSESCSDGQIVCNSGLGCYNTYERCNGHVDCSDYTDELGCGQCIGNHTACSLTSDVCFNPSNQRCNRVLDCPNGEDEQSCEPGCEGKILCASGVGCYTPDERCNGVNQCGDASDEKYCRPDLCRSERGGFLCGNRLCIREIYNCDRTNDCGDGTDETNCLKNSVIAAAVIGSLVCGLLLVVAISCSCKLYALRSATSSIVSRETPLSQLEREFMYREPPPSYAVATGNAGILFPDIHSGGSPPRHSRHNGNGRRSRSHRQRSQSRNFQPIDESLVIVAPPMSQQDEIVSRNSASVSCDNVSQANTDQASRSSVLEVASKKTTDHEPGQSNLTSVLEDNPTEDNNLAWKTESSLCAYDNGGQSTSDLFPLLPS